VIIVHRNTTPDKAADNLYEMPVGCPWCGCTVVELKAGSYGATGHPRISLYFRCTLCAAAGPPADSRDMVFAQWLARIPAPRAKPEPPPTPWEEIEL
jgi:hypothetical protein